MEMVRRQIERRNKKESDKKEYPVKIFFNGIELQGFMDEEITIDGLIKYEER